MLPRVPLIAIRRKEREAMAAQIGIQWMTEPSKEIQLGATSCTPAEQPSTSSIKRRA